MAEYSDSAPMTEERKVQLNKLRGQAAARMPARDAKEQQEKRDFTSLQGDMESHGQTSNATGIKLEQGANAILGNDGTGTGGGNLESHKKGTARVDHTGPANLHKDEAVLPKHLAEKFRAGRSMYSLAKQSLGGSEEESSSPKEVKEITIRKGASGGHILTHKHTDPMTHKDEDHVTKTDAEMHKHMADVMSNDDAAEGHDEPDADDQIAQQ